MRTWAARNRWWLARIASLPLHLLVFAIVVFLIVRLLPGDPAVQVTGGVGTPEDLKKVRESLGLDQPLFLQLGVFLLRLVQLNFGTSTSTGRTVFSDVIVRLPQTLELTFLALALAAILACLLSAAAVFLPRSSLALIARGYARAAGALPDFALGIIGILVFYVVLRVAPAPIGLIGTRMTAPPTITYIPLVDAFLSGSSAIVLSEISHLALPVSAMAIAYTPYLMKQLIPGLEEQMESEATRFRVSSGASYPMTVVSMFRRALPSVLVVSGSLLGGLIGGAVVMESMFGLGGIGQYAVSAVRASDYPAIQGVLIVIVTVVLLIFLVVDLLTLALDPRRRLGAVAS